MITANGNIFSTLKEFLEHSEYSVPYPQVNRFIRTNDEEKKWLKTAQVVDQPLPILPRLRVALVDYHENQYLVVIGWDHVVEPLEVATAIEINAGLATMLLAELQVPVRQFTNPLKVIDEIFIEGDDSNLAGFEANVVLQFFDPISVYEISENSSIKTNSIARLSCFFISKNKNKLSLPFSDDTINVLQRIGFEGVSSIPFENILHAMNAVRWEHAFLEVYRCVEQMFSVPTIFLLRQTLSLSTPIFNLSADIENITGWRAKEEDALKQICGEAPDEARKILLSIDDAPDMSEQANLGSFIYKQRNSIVHYRPGTKAVRMKDASWDKLIRGILLIIEYYYSKHHEILDSTVE